MNIINLWWWQRTETLVARGICLYFGLERKTAFKDSLQNTMWMHIWPLIRTHFMAVFFSLVMLTINQAFKVNWLASSFEESSSSLPDIYF